MFLNSFNFLVVFPFLFIFYWTIPHKCQNLRKLFLLILSYVLYIIWNPTWALILFSITSITYYGALAINYYHNKNKECKAMFILFVILTISPLLFFKYCKFITDNITTFTSFFEITLVIQGLNWIIPIGISFYTFQAASYLFDVYQKKVIATNNMLNYALFVSFFPQISAGPISRARILLHQLQSPLSFNHEKIKSGLKIILWGIFLKCVLADRIGIYVDSAFNNYLFLNGTQCFVSAILYSFQIYGDFAGYSLMAIGISKLLGLDLPDNFRRPYFSTSITDFWKRWHISLSTWLRDYIYIPLGGSRCSKTKNTLNIMITFLISGVWHGASWNFIIWGGLHGLYLVLEKNFGIQTTSNTPILKALRILLTFTMITLAWIFFRMKTLDESFIFLHKIFTNFDFTNFLISGINKTTIVIMWISIGMVLISDFIHEYSPSLSLFNNAKLSIRWLAYLFVLFFILLFGVLDSGQFIYVNF